MEFMQNLPLGERTDTDINTQFQALRDEWNPSAPRQGRGDIMQLI
jgi:hypothetical protein